MDSKDASLQESIRKEFLEPLNAELRGRYGVEARLKYVASSDPAINEPVLTIVYYAKNDNGRMNLEQKLSEIDDVTVRKFESFAFSSKALSEIYKQVDEISEKYKDKLSNKGLNIPMDIGEKLIFELLHLTEDGASCFIDRCLVDWQCHSVGHRFKFRQFLPCWGVW